MPAARLEHSPRLQRILAYLRDGLWHSTRDVVCGADVCAQRQMQLAFDEKFGQFAASKTRGRASRQFEVARARKKKRRQFEVSKAWAWEFDNLCPGRAKVLCSWAEPTREALKDKPTQDATQVAVYIIRRKDFDGRQSED